MATIVISSVGSDPGDDYSTLATWWAAKQGDLVAADEIQIAELRGELHDLGSAPALFMSSVSATTDADHYYHIRTMAGAEFDGQFTSLTNVARITSSSLSTLISCSVDHTLFEGFVILDCDQIVSGMTLAGSSVVVDSVGINNFYAFANNVAVNLYAIQLLNGATARNCIINDIVAAGGGTKNFVTRVMGVLCESTGSRVYNCTIANLRAANSSTAGTASAVSYGIYLGNGAVYCQNNLVVKVLVGAVSGITDAYAFYSVGYAATYSNNASDDSTVAWDTTSIANVVPTVELFNSAALSFQGWLVGVNSQCFRAGIDLSSTGFSDDVEGESRGTSWDIGADQYLLKVDACDTSLSVVDHERRSIGVDQPPGTGSNYPFIRPENSEETVIGDLFLRYRDDDCEFELPFRVVWLYNFGCAETPVDSLDGIPTSSVPELLIVDANDEEVFNTSDTAYSQSAWDTTEFSRTAWGPRAWILEWKHLAANEITEILRVVWYMQDVDSEETAFPRWAVLDNGWLDGRAITRTASRITSISLGAFAIGEGGNPTGILAGGYNTLITPTTTIPADGGRRVTTVNLDMKPGLGLGKYVLDCDDVTSWGIKRINNIEPTDHQNFNITTEENSCTRVQRPWYAAMEDAGACRGAKIRNSAIEIDGDCPPCCTCDDFIAVYESVRNLSVVLTDYVERAHTVRDWLSSSVTRMEQQRECRAAHRLRAYAQSECPHKIACSIAYCNSTEDCVTNVLLPISFKYADTLTPNITAITKYRPTSSVTPPGEICGYTKRAGNVAENYIYQLAVPYVLGGTYPHFWAFFDGIEPYSMGFITFFIEYPFSQRGDTARFAVDAYSLPEPPVVAASDSSLPYLTDYGYKIGSGPETTSSPCLDWRLVDQPLVAGAGMLQKPCCVDKLSDFDEVVS